MLFYVVVLLLVGRGTCKKENQTELIDREKYASTHIYGCTSLIYNRNPPSMSDFTSLDHLNMSYGGSKGQKGTCIYHFGNMIAYHIYKEICPTDLMSSVDFSSLFSRYGGFCQSKIT